MKLFYRTLAAAVAAILFLIAAPITFASHVAAEFAPALFGPLDATMSLALDRISAYMRAESTAARSAFRAFVERSLTHDDFSAGQFDPGRMPA